MALLVFLWSKCVTIQCIWLIIRVRDRVVVFRHHLYPFFRKEAKTNKKLLRSSNNFLVYLWCKCVTIQCIWLIIGVRDGLGVLDNTYTHFVPKEDKTNKNCLEAVNAFLSVSMVNNLSQSKAFDKLYELEMD